MSINDIIFSLGMTAFGALLGYIFSTISQDKNNKKNFYFLYKGLIQSFLNLDHSIDKFVYTITENPTKDSLIKHKVTIDSIKKLIKENDKYPPSLLPSEAYFKWNKMIHMLSSLYYLIESIEQNTLNRIYQVYKFKKEAESYLSEYHMLRKQLNILYKKYKIKFGSEEMKEKIYNVTFVLLTTICIAGLYIWAVFINKVDLCEYSRNIVSFNIAFSVGLGALIIAVLTLVKKLDLEPFQKDILKYVYEIVIFILINFISLIASFISWHPIIHIFLFGNLLSTWFIIFSTRKFMKTIIRAINN